MTKNILILHGWASHLANWQPFVKLLTQKGFSVYQPTMPGFGKTKIKSPWNTQDYVNWLNQYLTKNKLTKIVLIGHSFGGQVAIQFTSQFPKIVYKLVLISSAGIRTQWTLKRFIFYLIAKTGRMLFSLEFLRGLFHPVRKFFYKAIRQKDYYQASRVMKKTLAKVVREDQRKFLSKIEKQVLMFWGQKDTTTPVKDGRLMNKLLPNSKLIIYKEASHSLPFTHTRKLIKRITWFIS